VGAMSTICQSVLDYKAVKHVVPNLIVSLSIASVRDVRCILYAYANEAGCFIIFVGKGGG